MKTINIVFAILLILHVCGACTDEDNKLGAEIPLSPPYELPEPGESEAGDRVIDFFYNYTTFLLYDYTQADFAWETVSTGMNYERVLGDPQYLGDMLDLLDDILLKFYPEEFKKESLPFKIFLADTIVIRARWPGQPHRYFKAIYRETALGVAGMNKDLSMLDAATKRVYKDEINKAFITYLLNQGKLEIPEEFYAVSDYSTPGGFNLPESDPKHPRNLGFLPTLDSETGDTPYVNEWATNSYMMADGKNSDVRTFLHNMVAHGSDYPVYEEGYPPYGTSYLDRFTWNHYLTFPLIKRKYDILQNFFLDRYNIDLAAIGNGAY